MKCANQYHFLRLHHLWHDYKLEGKIESILELLEEFGQVPQRIEELIRVEEDMNVLSGWLKSAAKATSIAEFEANM